MVSAALIEATTSERAPFLPARSMAMPRLTCSGEITAGLPSTSSKWEFISGCAPSALSTA